MIRKLLKVGVLLVGLAALLALLLGVAIYIENDRGEKAWKAYRSEAEYRGLVFEASALIPKAIPEASNFAATPLIKKWLTDPVFLSEFSERPEWEAPSAFMKESKTANRDGQGQERLEFTPEAAQQVLAPFEAELLEITNAARRPAANFGLDYSNFIALQTPHLNPLIKYSHLYRLRALTALRTGHSEQALQDIETILKIGNHISSDSLLINHLMELAIIKSLFPALWEGLADHHWTEPELATLQSLLERAELGDHLVKAFNGERVFFFEIAQVLIRKKGHINEDPKVIEAVSPRWRLGIVPQGWVYQNLLTYNRCLDEQVLSKIDLKGHRVSTSWQDLKMDGNHPYQFLANLALPGLTGVIQRYAYTQTQLDSAIIACALERYRLAHGQFPEKLSALVPSYITKLPHDLFTGESLVYQREEGDGYLLYSVGWNEIDDGGKHGDTKTLDGDWVWRMPAAPVAR